MVDVAGQACSFRPELLKDELVDLYMLSSDDGHASNAWLQSDLAEPPRLVAAGLPESPAVDAQSGKQ